MKINILAPEVYNLLSAGEVVENPASVVKELCENALDANAAKITVEITNGGITEIIVTDNGDGCPEKELPKVFLPHSTSKIKTAQDISNIMSLGFRGEAMASICAVAKVKFLSKLKGAENAFIIDNKDNKVTIASRSDKGTTVTVSNLFYNTPARRKFLKNENAEKNLVTAVIHDIIFSHPNLSVKYIIDGSVNIDFRGAGVAGAIQQIYRIDAANEMLPVSKENGIMKVTGFISMPRLSKNNKTRQIVIINGRVISGGVIADAVNAAMADFLMVGVYPVFVLNVTVDTAEVDVNVHPQKKEVRFDNSDRITQFIKTAITAALDDYFLRQQNFSAAPAAEISPAETLPAYAEVPTEKIIPAASPAVPPTEAPTATPAAEIPAAPDAAAKRPVAGYSFNPDTASKLNKTVFLKSLKLFDAAPKNSSIFAAASQKSADRVASSSLPLSFFAPAEIKPQPIQTAANYGREWEIVGSVFDTYLLVKTKDTLIMIDQHAAHERLNYDNFKTQCDKNNIASQILLEPITINLTPKEMVSFEKTNPHLSSLGFECCEFGENIVRIISLPQILTSFSAADFLHAVLSDKELQAARLSDIIKDKIAQMACKASIKAGDTLTYEQIESFITRLQTKTPIPLCPHGRPILITLTKSKIETMFGRKV
jgi:DNA mismatch repair protein MutL